MRPRFAAFAPRSVLENYEGRTTGAGKFRARTGSTSKIIALLALVKAVLIRNFRASGNTSSLIA
jgi:hypothetical protein